MRGGGRIAGSQPMSTLVHRIPNKIWRSNATIPPAPIGNAMQSEFDVPVINRLYFAYFFPVRRALPTSAR
jgi:hypothetical protein